MTAWANFGVSVAIIAGIAAAVWALACLADIATEWANGWRERAAAMRSKAAHAQSNEAYFRERVEALEKSAGEHKRDAARAVAAYENCHDDLMEMTAKRDAAVAEARRWKALAMKARAR